jgi:hypothetical protein
MKLAYVLAILLVGSVVANSDHLIAANFGREDSGASDEYKLYDRNTAGLDWNRYSYPTSEPRQEPYFNSGGVRTAPSDYNSSYYR